MKRLLIPWIAFSLLAACAPTPSLPPDTSTNSQTPGQPPAYAPRPGDEDLARGEVFLDSTDILIMESYPLQFSILLKGSLPTPCHELRLSNNGPDLENRIKLEAYSIVDPDAVCVQMLQPFEQNVYLGSFPSGHYTVWVNGEQSGEFDA